MPNKNQSVDDIPTVSDVVLTLNEPYRDLFIRTLALLQGPRVGRLENLDRYILPGHRAGKVHQAFPSTTHIVDRGAMLRSLGSSFVLFTGELRRTTQRIRRLVAMWTDDCILFARRAPRRVCYDAERKRLVDSVLMDYPEGTPAEAIVFHRDDFRESFITDMRDNLLVFNRLLCEWRRALGLSRNCKIPDDPKFDALWSCLPALTDARRKVVVVAASAAVVSELKALFDKRCSLTRLPADGVEPHDRVLVLTGPSGRSTAEQNFGIRVPEDLRADDYDILITTMRHLKGLDIGRVSAIVDYDLAGDLASMRTYSSQSRDLGDGALPVQLCRLCLEPELAVLYMEACEAVHSDGVEYVN